MPARHAFVCVLATALIAVTAALLHPLLGLGPLQVLDGLDGPQAQSSPAKMGNPGGSTASVTLSR